MQQDNSVGARQVQSGIDYKYRMLNLIGEGAYGRVYDALNLETNTGVCIKVNQPFGHPIFALRAYRELKLMKLINGKCQHIVKLHAAMFDDRAEQWQVKLVVERMSSDLHKVISNNCLAMEHVKYIMFQLVEAVRFLHASGIIHRDIKPSNVFINSDCRLKLGDFGLSRCIAPGQRLKSSPLDMDNEQLINQEQTGSSDTNQVKDNQRSCDLRGDFQCKLTEYVATRWYRSPEVLLQQQYSHKLDIWALGCVLAEMLLGKAIFPGKNIQDQLQRIVLHVGHCYDEQLAVQEIKSTTLRQTVMGCPGRPLVPLTERLQGVDLMAIDLASKLLAFKQDDRPEAGDIYLHPFMEKFGKFKKDLSNASLIYFPDPDLNRGDDQQQKIVQLSHLIQQEVLAIELPPPLSLL
ncbi:hypothetical protein MP228_010962 [Amoeboaphelidium protococcarum]|nr:hypothetical protein MP228_010962 [Amoeboaphelidium protococcarum]